MLWEILEISGTIAFAAAGSLVGIKKRLDIFGVAMLAVTTAVGGGIIRDTLLGNVPPLAFRNPTFILLSLLVSIVVSFYATSVAWRKTMLRAAATSSNRPTGVREGALCSACGSS